MPIQEAKDEPIISNNRFTLGVPIKVPVNFIPPDIVYNDKPKYAGKNFINQSETNCQIINRG